MILHMILKGFGILCNYLLKYIYILFKIYDVEN
jgi:hypothetical protein